MKVAMNKMITNSKLNSERKMLSICTGSYEIPDTRQRTQRCKVGQRQTFKTVCYC